jgi:hypothetical protein
MRLALCDNVRTLRPRTTLIDEQRNSIAQQAIVVEPSNGLNQQHCTSLISNGFAAARHNKAVRNSPTSFRLSTSTASP